jgi:hypothetical protein
VLENCEGGENGSVTVDGLCGLIERAQDAVFRTKCGNAFRVAILAKSRRFLKQGVLKVANTFII